MQQIIGLDGLEDIDIQRELERGAKFRIYQYTISLLVVTFKRPSGIHFIRAGHSSVSPGLKYSLLSFVFGWWGFPWGLIYTPQAIFSNLGGGVDVTAAVKRELVANQARR